jgi:hypothetical protein
MSEQEQKEKLYILSGFHHENPISELKKMKEIMNKTFELDAELERLADRLDCMDIFCPNCPLHEERYSKACSLVVGRNRTWRQKL